LIGEPSLVRRLIPQSVPDALEEVPEVTMEKFHYTLPDGHELVLPKFENVPMGHIRKIRKLDETDQVFTLLESLLDEDELEHVDTLDRPAFQKLMEAWREESDVDLGESRASSST
jgi:hypothetical protein